MASIERIAKATVTKTSANVSRQGFKTLLGTQQVATGVQSERFKTYSSLSEMTDVGFLTTDRAYLWATVAFSQSPSPSNIAIGRRIPGTAQERALIITAVAVGDWTLDLDDGDGVRQYGASAGASDTEITLAEKFRVQIAQDNDAFVTVPLVATGTATIPITIGIAGETFTAVLTPAGAGTGTTAETVVSIAPEAMATCLAAIETENEKDWFLFTIDTRNDTDILAAAVFAGARHAGVDGSPKLFLAQSKDPTWPTGTAGNIGLQLGAFSYKNVWAGYYASDLDFFDAGMGAIAAAADLDAENGAITWANKQITGVAFSDLTSSEIDIIVGTETVAGNNGNVYVEIASRGITLSGKAVSGEFADVETTMAWAKARVQEATFVAIATQPGKLPYTNAGIAVVDSSFLGVLLTGVKNGHFSGDDPTSPSVTGPSVSGVPAVDKQNRVLRNRRGEAIFAGAIHSTILQLDLRV